MGKGKRQELWDEATALVICFCGLVSVVTFGTVMTINPEYQQYADHIPQPLTCPPDWRTHYADQANLPLYAMDMWYDVLDQRYNDQELRRARATSLVNVAEGRALVRAVLLTCLAEHRNL